MASSTRSKSTRAAAPKPSSPGSSSRSRERSRAAAEPTGSRFAFDARHDLAVPLPVEVERRSTGVERAWATNLSPGGICLHLRAPLPVGEPVRVCLSLPDGDAPIEARGRVTWSESPAPEAEARFFEVGVRFEVVAEADRRRLQALAADVTQWSPRPS
jgi:uncharacterized protein (TIGR02266 family)